MHSWMRCPCLYRNAIAIVMLLQVRLICNLRVQFSSSSLQLTDSTETPATAAPSHYQVYNFAGAACAVGDGTHDLQGALIN